MIVVDGVVLGRCVTVRELIQRFGISKTTARKRLRRLERRGLVERRRVGRVVLYCAREGVQVAASPQPSRSPGPVAGTRRRMEEVAGLVVREGCITTSTLILRYGVSHTQAFHVLRLLQYEGRVVEVVVGNTALWCRDRDAAQRFVEELAAVVRRLVEQHRLRYVTPKRLFQLIANDPQARQAFSRIVNIKTPSASVYSVLKTLLDAVYGKPISKSIYYTQQAAVNSVSIDIKDKEVGEYVAVRLTPDLAEALSAQSDVDSLVIQAIEQLLQRYRP